MQISCPCQASNEISREKNLIECKACQSHQHLSCIGEASKMKVYLCPGCQIKKSDYFIRPIFQNILPPSLIKINSPFIYSFSCITNFSDYFSKKGNRPNYLVIRCLKLTEDGFEIEWPHNCSLSINDKLILSFTDSESNVNQRKIHQPLFFWVKITNVDKNSYINPSTQKVYLIKDYFRNDTPNKISINVKPGKNDKLNRYCLSIDYVETISNVKDIIKTIPRVSVAKDVCKLIYRGEISPAKQQINIMDYSFVEPIKIPARGVNCQHFEVFDLEQFLLYQKKTRTFRCSFCNKSVCLMYIDEVMKEIIEKRAAEGKQDVIINEKMQICSDSEGMESSSISDDDPFNNSDSDDQVMFEEKSTTPESRFNKESQPEIVRSRFLEALQNQSLKYKSELEKMFNE